LTKIPLKDLLFFQKKFYKIFSNFTIPIAKYFLTLPLFIFGSCDMFEVRESENPIISKKDYEPAYEVDKIFQNLNSAFKNKSVEAYMICFIDTNFSNKSFTFIPSSNLIGSSIFNFWSLQKEYQWFQSFIGNNLDKKIEFRFEATSQKNEGANWEIMGNYIITIEDLLQGSIERYEGASKFLIELNARSYYAIYEWNDYKINEMTTWSELKAKYY